MSKLRIGVIYWERTGSSDTYFGYHIGRSLSPSKYRQRTPYYADILSEEQIAFHTTTQEEYDRELQYAIDAGIDYFAYTWNSDEKENRIDFPKATDEQIKKQLEAEDCGRRKLHTKSIFKTKIKLCAIVLCQHPFSDNDIERLMNEMREEYYEKVDQRPLLYIYGGYRTDFIEKIRKSAKENHLPDPYIVFFNNGAISENGDYSMADAVSGYSFIDRKMNEKGFSYLEFCKSFMKENEERKKYNLDIIPLFSAGWNSMPRIDNIVPWYPSYPLNACADIPTNQELLDGASLLCNWIKANASYMQSAHVLTFAWNEFEEGAWICPTYGHDMNTDASRIQAFSEIVKAWKQSYENSCRY